MKKEIKDNELEMINGGSYHIYNNDKITFDNVPGVYQLCHSRYEAQAEMDALIGKFNTTAEYDRACFQLLCDKGWLA